MNKTICERFVSMGRSALPFTPVVVAIYLKHLHDEGVGLKDAIKAPG
jgi:hypothetical protein